MIKNSLIHLGIAAVFFAAALGIYAAIYVAIGQESARAAVLAEQIQQKTQDAAGVAAAKAALASLTSDETTIDSHFVSSSEVVAFLGALQSTGTALGADVQVVSVSSDNAKTHPHLLLAVRISGSFDAVTRTLGSIEHGPYDIILTDLSFDATPSTTPGSKAVWTAAAKFSVGMRTLPVTISPAP